MPSNGEERLGDPIESRYPAGMGQFTQVILALVVIYAVYRVARRVVRGPAPAGFKCETCRNCGKLFDDGVLCRFMGRETFKNETHIANCLDYENR